jgi:hypothetical protein
MRESKVDRFFDGVDQVGDRFPRATRLSRNRFSSGIQKLGRNHPLVGSLAQSLLAIAIMFAVFSLRSLGRDEGLVAWICGFGGLVFFGFMVLYNHRHHRRDRDLDAVPSADSNRLTGRH